MKEEHIEAKDAANEELNEVMRIRREKLDALMEADENPFEITKFERDHLAGEVTAQFERIEGETVCVAGRMMSRRVMGKASFAHIQDQSGMLQLYVRIDEVGSEEYAKFKSMDIGDFLGVTGTVFKTNHGEISVRVKTLKLLSKSLRPLPEKFHGLTNQDAIYRQRYLDLIMNQESKERFLKRSQIIREIRNFLDARGFVEVETPMLVSNAGGAAARPFETHYNSLNEDVKLRISHPQSPTLCKINNLNY